MDRTGLQSRASFAAAALAAALGCLQPGIDPVFLSLLSQTSQVPLTAHGLIVGATQAGAALGSLAVWRIGPLLPRAAIPLAACIALACSATTALFDTLPAILSVRCCYGVAMGMVYTRCMAAYAARRPTRAFGAVFLIQLVLSTLVSLALPELAHAAGADVALTFLAFVPATAIVALFALPQRDALSEQREDAENRAAVPAQGWALAAATFWFICATMLIWSFSAGLATSAGLDDRTIARAVAIGSLCGALTAVAVMREKVLVPLPVTALLASGALVSPILLTAPGGDALFIVSIVLLNIGSTAIIIRCSGLAAASSQNSRFRTFVACTHSLGLIAGPLLGSVAASGPVGLLGGLFVALSAGLCAVTWASFVAARRGIEGQPDAASADVKMALD